MQGHYSLKINNLLSDLSSGVTGDIHFVDSGNSNMSMPTLDQLKRLDS